MLTWVSADLRTGQVLADLPGLVCDYPLRRTIGAYDTATAHLHLDGAPPNWEYATREGGALLAAYDDDDDSRSIVWAGFVSKQVRNTSSSAVDLALVTGEGYLDRRYVGNRTYKATGQNTIVADLVYSYVVGGAEPGLPITVNTIGGTPGALRDRTYLDADNATVYTRLAQLMAVGGGPEFTIEWSWSNSGQSIVPTLIVGDRLGAAKPADLPSPHVMFELPGSVLEVEQTRDYSNGKGANKVSAYSSGQGDAAPTSGPFRAADDGRPTFEFRWSPSSSITDVSTLQNYARQALALLAPGARATTLTATRANAPRVGSAFRLGDDVGYRVGGIDESGRDIVPMFPGGMSGVGRVIAYELTDTTVSPILAEAVVPTDDGGVSA